MKLPASKQELLDGLRQERSEWEALLAKIGPDRFETTGVTDGWTMMDTIAHLTACWRREAAWLAAVGRGERPPDHPAPPEVLFRESFDWMEGRTLGAGILHDFVSHLHEEHEPLIRAWLEAGD